MYSSSVFKSLLNLGTKWTIDKVRFSTSLVRIAQPREQSKDAIDCSDDQRPPTAENLPQKRGLVLGLYECLEETNNKEYFLTKTGETVDSAHGSGFLEFAKKNLGLGYKENGVASFSSLPSLTQYKAVALASLGHKDAGYNMLEKLHEDKENVRMAVGNGVRELVKRGMQEIHVDDMGEPQAAAEASVLAAWKFDKYMPCEVSPKIMPVHGELASGEAWKTGTILAQAQNTARYLAECPGNDMTPLAFSQFTIDHLCKLGVKVTVYDKHWIKKQNMRALLAVAKGSVEPPYFMEITYSGSAEPPVLICSKGVTFDSGGLCLKSAEHMLDSRGCIAGAAALVGVFEALAKLQVPVNVSAVVPLCENMIGGGAMRVGDVIPALNGVNILVEDTDMEGRLIMSDAIIYGRSVFKPRMVMTLAAMTQGLIPATGTGVFGCFTNTEPGWSVIEEAGALTGDRAWRYPLFKYYDSKLKNIPGVDLRNKGSGKASPCNAAAFLYNFVCEDFVHLDITGVGRIPHSKPYGYLAEGIMTGRPTRTIVQFLRDLDSKTKKERSEE